MDIHIVHFVSVAAGLLIAAIVIIIHDVRSVTKKHNRKDFP